MMNNWKWTTVLLVIFGVVFTHVKAQDSSIEARVDSLMSPWNGTDVPGAVVAYFEGDQGVFKKAYGLANLEHRVVMKTGTVSDLGSVSKQFIGFAMALLEDRGMLNLDDDVRTYLPQLPDFGKSITIRHLLNHTSGLREVYNTLGMIYWKPGDRILQEDAQKLVSFQKVLQFEPGSRYLYNNTEYMLLADIVEEVSGMEYQDWMSQNIFEPLGMSATSIMHEQGQVISDAATSYRRSLEGGFVQEYDNSTVQGAGGIYSTVEDLGRWMNNLSNTFVGSANTVEKLVTRGRLTNGDTLSYGLGMNVSQAGNTVVWSHSGASAGYRSYFIYLPDLQRGMVFLTNTSAHPIPLRDLEQVFMGDVLKYPEEEPAHATGTSGVDETQQTSNSALDPELFTGRYLSDELQVFYEIRELDDGLQLYHRWLGEWPLNPRGSDVFRLGGQSDSLSFERDASGSVVGFTLDTGRTFGVAFRRITM